MPKGFYSFMDWVNSNNIRSKIYYYHFLEPIEDYQVTLYMSTNNSKIKFDVVEDGKNICYLPPKDFEKIPEDIRNIFELYMSDPLFEIELKREIERQK